LFQRSEIGAPSAWTELPKHEMDEILRISQKEGYRAALEYLGRRHTDLLEYIISNVRVDWLFHCYNDSHKTLCLDLGSGWGGLAIPLSNFFHETISLERSFAKLAFQNLRAKQDNIQSVSFLGADWNSLPFPNDKFDLVAANGVLEWAAFSRDGDPRTVQRDFLLEIRRCLKPGGCAYIGIENRFGFNFLLGGRDHTSLPFTGLLPRRFADFVVSHARGLQGWHRYYTYTYSPMGYKSLLSEAGFGDIDFYWVYPSYSCPKFASKLWNASSYLFFADYHLKTYRDMSLGKRLLAHTTKLFPDFIPSRVCPSIWPELLIFAWKGVRHASVEDAIVDGLESDCVVRMSGGERHSSKISFAIMKNQNVVSFAKLSRFGGREELEAEERLLRKYARSQYTEKSWGRFSIFTETPLLGHMCDLRNLDDNRKAIAWLMKFQEETGSDPLKPEDATFERHQIMDALSKTSLNATAIDHLALQVERFMLLLTSRGLAKCSEHGDFWPGNILISDDEVLTLDWEFYKASGNPLFDFCNFLVANSSRPKLEKSFVENLSGHGSYSTIMHDLVRRYCDRYRLSTEVILLGIPYVLSRCVARYSVYSDDCSPTNYQQNIQLLDIWEQKLRNVKFSWIE
jgi:SAM-dependent methyltransferase